MKSMNGITDVHIFVLLAYVRVGYSIHTLHETTKINFQLLNERTAYNLMYYIKSLKNNTYIFCRSPSCPLLQWLQILLNCFHDF